MENWIANIWEFLMPISKVSRKPRKMNWSIGIGKYYLCEFVFQILSLKNSFGFELGMCFDACCLIECEPPSIFGPPDGNFGTDWDTSSLVRQNCWSMNFYNTDNFRRQSPKFENGFKHLWHLASGRAMKTNDENVRFFFFG